MTETTNPTANTVHGSPAVETSSTVVERRNCSRLGQQAAASLVGWGGVEPIPCRVQNIASGGIYVHAQDVPELSVGRRYEIVVNDTDTLGDVLGDGCYATVIRTEFVEQEGDRMIGAGLRFDRPLAI